ncbi:hypothetical protein BY458DRAFT_554554 [Sporodiniella umbellata]|nr:hypothetical protein BY458DRAFT_554554 [Sporodiniella umbellata]
MSSIRFLAPVFRRSLTTSRSFQTSAVVCNDFGKQANRSFVDRFKSQTNEDADKPTRLIKIEALPSTSTLEDIRKLAREAFDNGDRSIRDIVFCRKDNLAFDGNCVVLLNSPEDATRLISYGNRRSLGGNIIKMSYVSKISQNPEGYLDSLRKPQLKSKDNTKHAAGSSVIISGHPFRNIDNILGYLRSKNFFPLDGVPDSAFLIQQRRNSPVNRFLVKFESESEAWRCVRAFHNSKYTLTRTGEVYNIYAEVVY